jgi:adenine deaminase
MTDIVQAALDAGVTIQGHSPLLMGRDLNAYVAAGIESITKSSKATSAKRNYVLACCLY